jgi:Zn finger protein HypA/HybF involved in hydrogenase expression
MTIENCWMVDLEDLSAIELKCKSCGATQTFPPAYWKGQIPNNCPNCNLQWFQVNAPSEVSLQRVITNFELLVKEDAASGCKIRLRIETAPTPSGPRGIAASKDPFKTTG